MTGETLALWLQKPHYVLISETDICDISRSTLLASLITISQGLLLLPPGVESREGDTNLPLFEDPLPLQVPLGALDSCGIPWVDR